MLTYILILLCLPPLCAVLALAAGFGNILHWLHRLTATAVGVCVALMAKSFNPAVPYVDDYFYIDALNMWVIIIITTLYLAATWTARNYLTREERCGVDGVAAARPLLCADAAFLLDDVHRTAGKKLGSDVGSHRSDYLNQCVAHFL